MAEMSLASLGQKLAQTWPARLAKDAWGAVTLPGDVYQGNVSMYDEDGRTNPEVINRSMDLAGLVTGGSYAAPAMKDASGMGIRAYHSSPHDFDKFDLAKIGTGEGAQVYGHGLYFAENPAVSGQGGQYWNQFLQRFEKTPEGDAASLLRNSEFDLKKATDYSDWNIKDLQSHLAKHDDPALAKLLEKRIAAHELLTSGKPVGPRTYEVNIKADPAQMLDWDKGLHTQSPEVRAALERFGFKADKNLMRAHDDALMAALEGNPNITIPKPLPDPTGAQIYESSRLVPGGYRDKVRATERLQEAGIPGIKYLDQGSRLAKPVMTTTPHGDVIASHYPPKSSNYVVFDDKLIDIMKKYGLAGLAPLAGYGAMQQGQQPSPRM